MKPLLIANLIYIPITDSNKYIQGSINGELFINKIFTLDEIKAKHPVGGSYELIECDHLHDLCKKWGSR